MNTLENLKAELAEIVKKQKLSRKLQAELAEIAKGWKLSIEKQKRMIIQRVKEALKKNLITKEEYAELANSTCIDCIKCTGSWFCIDCEYCVDCINCRNLKDVRNRYHIIS